MNGALLGLTVVAAIGVVLWAVLFIGGRLIDTSLARRRAFALGGRHMPSRILRDLKPVEDVVVDFVRHSRDLADVLAVLTATTQPKSFGKIVDEIQIGHGRRTEAAIAAYSAATALSILFVSGLTWLTRNGFVATEVGREVQRRIEGAPGSTDRLLPNALSTAS
jgi:hypothetical protein